MWAHSISSRPSRAVRPSYHTPADFTASYERGSCRLQGSQAGSCYRTEGMRTWKEESLAATAARDDESEQMVQLKKELDLSPSSNGMRTGTSSSLLTAYIPLPISLAAPEYARALLCSASDALRDWNKNTVPWRLPWQYALCAALYY